MPEQPYDIEKERKANERQILGMRLTNAKLLMSLAGRCGVKGLWKKLMLLKNGTLRGVDHNSLELLNPLIGPKELKARLSAEIQFYEALYKAPKSGLFRVSLKKRHTCPVTLDVFSKASTCPFL